MNADLETQVQTRLPAKLLDRVDRNAAKAGLRRAAYVRSVVLHSLSKSSSSLPTMAHAAAGGTAKDELLSLRLRVADLKRLELAARKRGGSVSEFLRAVLTRSVEAK